MAKKKTSVQRRDEQFSDRQTTKICLETPAPDNPYIASSSSCYGYDLLDLMDKCSIVDCLFLLFNAQLPSKAQAQLLNCLMIALINPGPRHAATRAAMNTGIGKTDTTHILPISLGILSGQHLGAGEIESSMRFIRKNINKNPAEISLSLLASEEKPNEGDWHPAPGFGSRFSSIDIIPQQIASKLISLPGAGKCLRWGNEFAKSLSQQQMGWLMTGVAAAALADLGFHPRCGAGIFQLLSAPGLLAHGLEMATKPITAMPFLADEDYLIEE